MPKVGNKHYPYTKAGVKAAKNEASKTGQDIQTSDARNRGNVTMGYRGGGPTGQITKPPIAPGTEGKKKTRDPFDTSGREYQKGGITEIGDYSEGRWNDLLPDAISPSTPAVYGEPRNPIGQVPDELSPYGGPRENPRTPIQPVGDELVGGPDDEMTDFDEHSHMYAEGGKTKAGGVNPERVIVTPEGKLKWVPEDQLNKQGGRLRPHKGEEDPKTGPTYATGGKTGARGFSILDPDDYAEKMEKHIGSGGAFGNKKGGKVKKKKKK